MITTDASWLAFTALMDAQTSQAQAIAIVQGEARAEVQRLLATGVSEDEVAVAWGVSLEVVQKLRRGDLVMPAATRNDAADVAMTLQRSLWLPLEGLVSVEPVSPHALRCYWNEPTRQAQHFVSELCRTSSVLVEHAECAYTRDELTAAVDHLHRHLGEIRCLVDFVDCYAAPNGIIAIGRGMPTDRTELERLSGPLVTWRFS